MGDYRKLPQHFKHRGVDFMVLKRGKNAIMLSATAPFYDCASVEVWHLKISPERIIDGNILPPSERKPVDEHYPYSAHQFMEKHYNSHDAMWEAAEKRFNEYEQGLRPKSRNQ